MSAAAVPVCDHAKPELRRAFCTLREGRPRAWGQEASAALCQRLAAWPTLRAAQIVLTYLAFRDELDLNALFGLLPQVHWAVPRVAGKQLAIHSYHPQRLARHRFGMLDPQADLPAVAAESIDVVLVPGVAFDLRGGRLGFGGGYYDRFLPTTRALRVGISDDACLVDELPCNELDQRMDWIATPSQLVRCPMRELPSASAAAGSVRP